jgi:hypothetical protein
VPHACPPGGGEPDTLSFSEFSPTYGGLEEGFWVTELFRQYFFQKIQHSLYIALTFCTRLTNKVSLKKSQGKHIIFSF